MAGRRYPVSAASLERLRVPLHYQITDNPTAHVDPRAIRWFCNYCIQHFPDDKVKKIILFGSRATGYRSRGGAVDEKLSDYDFYIVFDDSIPDGFQTTGVEAMNFFNGALSIFKKDFGRDLHILSARSTDFDISAHDLGSYAYQALNQGHVLAVILPDLSSNSLLT